MNSFRLEWHEGCICLDCLSKLKDITGKPLIVSSVVPCIICGDITCQHSKNHSLPCLKERRSITDYDYDFLLENHGTQ